MVAYWYPPQNESGALRPYRFCKYLDQFGFEPHVLSAPLTSGTENAPNVHRPTARPTAGWHGTLGSLLRRAAPYDDRLEWVVPGLQLGSRLVDQLGISVVVSSSPPVATHLVAWRLAQRSRLAWIADFRDPMSGNPFRTRWHGRIYDRAIENRVVSRAQAVILNTDAALESMARRHPRLRHKFHVIWNGYDPQDDLAPLPVPPRPYRVLAHLGNLYGGRHPGALLESLMRLCRLGKIEPASLRLRLIGSIENGELWTRSDAALFLTRVGALECTDRVSRGAAHREMAEADSLLLLDLNALESAVQVPAKLFEYVRVGRPILALTTRTSPVERILQRAGVPHTCIYGDEPAAQIDVKVQQFLALSHDPVIASGWFREQFDAVRQTRSLAALCEQAVLSRV